MPTSRSKRVTKLARKRMKSHIQGDDKWQQRHLDGVDRIGRLIRRGIKRSKFVDAMFSAEDKKKKQVRKNYPKFARG